MAEEEETNMMGFYPAPPYFWQSFTSTNLSRLSELRHAQAVLQKKPTDAASLQEMRLLELPAELRFLQSPKPPLDGRYRLFGENYNLDNELPTLEELGIEVLYNPPSAPGEGQPGKTNDRAFVLKKIAKSLLLNFMELTGILSINPDHAAEKIDHLRALFINFHHLLNEYRPHQARESLILMMEEQLEKSRTETEGILKAKAQVEEVLAGLAKIEPVDTGLEISGGGVTDVEDEGRDVWEALDREFGLGV